MSQSFRLARVTILILAVSSLLMPLSSLAQVDCAPPGFSYAGPVNVSRRDNCNDLQWGQGPVWSHTVNKLSGAGGTLTYTVDTPPRGANDPPLNTGGRLLARCNGIVLSASSYALAYGPQHFEASVTIPTSSATSITIDLYPDNSSTNCNDKIIPAFTITNIVFSTAGPQPLPNPVVADVVVCEPSAAPLSVTNPQAGVDYYWYTTATSAPEVHRGTTYDLPITANTEIYVQAIPNGAFACPSPGRTRAAVTLRPTVQPALSLPPSVLKDNALIIDINGLPSYTYQWDWGDGSISSGTTLSHSYSALGSYVITLNIVDNSAARPCSLTMTYSIEVRDILCETRFAIAALSDIKVNKNNRTGSYVFTTNDCAVSQTVFDCLTGQGQQREVVAASAISFTDASAAPDVAYQNFTAADIAVNPLLAGAGRPHPEATYAYSTPVIDTYQRSTERGRFLVVPFNWQVGARHRLPAWQRAGLATRFSPNGEAVEEKDILEVLSTVKMGYLGQALPYLTAKNAGFNQVLFEACEKMSDGDLRGEDRFQVSAAEAQLEKGLAHSGLQSLQLKNSSGNATLTLPSFAANDLRQGLQCKVWLRVSEAATPAQALSQATILAPAGATWAVRWAAGQITPLNIIAQSGEWLLAEATFPGLAPPAPTSYTPQLLVSGFGTRTVWVDDVRLQPRDAQMTCYVYNPTTLKLLASFDDQHFGLYYQYNAEGKLVRKQVETERGLRTIQETQYNTPAAR
jgi:hypothetical protein